VSISSLLLLHDGNAMAPGVAATLKQIVPVLDVNLLDSAQPKAAPANGAVLCVQLSTIKNFGTFAPRFDISIDGTVIVIPSFSEEYVAQLNKFGIKNYLVAPAAPNVLISAVSAARIYVLETGWQDLSPVTRDALVGSRHSFTQAFADVRNGGHVDIPEIEAACALIADCTKESSLSAWLAAIEDHHDYTYRHCMSVCGAIVHFGHNIGIKADDLTLLSVGGMLHDIGKAWVSLGILDKPAKLDDSEQVKMREHPAFSREIMDSMEGLDPRVVAMAVHHHEKLDGSGYPDGLNGDQLDDLVRLTSIADIFSALIDERAYKPAMSYEKAFGIMTSMKGHLDLDMLAKFEEYAMDARAKTA